MDNKKICVTQPSMPRMDEFVKMLEDIWQSKWLTNMGKYHQMFENDLCQYLGVNQVSLFCNGTIALQLALKALEVTGEVITTPFTFPATAHALKWNGCTPVFCDIDEETFNIDVDKIEALITDKTRAILPVHVYGNPCDMKKIQKIANRYNLKVIYDAAHAFGVKKNEKPIVAEGDISMLSFHATKIFNTIEGGALIIKDPKIKKRVEYLKNFGIADETTIVDVGTNGKMNELQAAYGILMLKQIDEDIKKCKAVYERYNKNLRNSQKVKLVNIGNEIKWNYSYCPVLVGESLSDRDCLYDKLRKKEIYARKYFYPLLSEIDVYRDKSKVNQERLTVANKISDRVLCLPIYPHLELTDVDELCAIISK